MNKILVIEADANLAERLCRALRDTETHVFSCGTLEAATALMEKELYQQIIIDTELPDGDGYDLIYELGLGIYDSRRVESKKFCCINSPPNTKKKKSMILNSSVVSGR